MNVAVASPTTKLIDEICVVGDADGFHDCGIVFQPGHRVRRPIRFKLMTNCATGDTSATLDATYQLQPSFFDFTKVNRFWVNHQFPEIRVGYFSCTQSYQKHLQVTLQCTFQCFV